MSLVCVTVVPTILLKDFVPTLNVTKRFFFILQELLFIFPFQLSGIVTIMFFFVFLQGCAFNILKTQEQPVQSAFLKRKENQPHAGTFLAAWNCQWLPGPLPFQFQVVICIAMVQVGSGLLDIWITLAIKKGTTSNNYSVADI